MADGDELPGISPPFGGIHLQCRWQKCVPLEEGGRPVEMNRPASPLLLEGDTINIGGGDIILPKKEDNR